MSGKSAVGRTGSLRLYKYPEPRFGGGSAGVFARNFATGPKEETLIEGSTLLPWNAIDVGTSPGVDVPITPLSTGWIRISAVVSLGNISEGDIASGEITILIDDVELPVPPDLEFVIADGGTVIIPILAEVELPLGVEANVSLRLSADNPDSVVALTDSSAMELLEVPASTG